MICPDCGTQLLCGCTACRKHHPAKYPALHFITLCDDLEQCPLCNKVEHMDWWSAKEQEQIAEMKKKMDDFEKKLESSSKVW